MFSKSLEKGRLFFFQIKRVSAKIFGPDVALNAWDPPKTINTLGVNIKSKLESLESEDPHFTQTMRYLTF